MKFQRSIMAKWKVKEGAESFIIKCANCEHAQATHFNTSTGKLKLTKCSFSKCDCKEFKSKIKDKLKGLLQKD